MIAIVAAALPGVDPVSMLIEMVPLLVLYELSIVLARVLGGRAEGERGGRSPHRRSREGEMAQAATSTGWSSTFAGRRKHVVKVVYAILAVLMGASLFLVVGPVNIGELFSSNASSGGEAAKPYEEQAERLEAKLKKEPEDRTAAGG